MKAREDPDAPEVIAGIFSLYDMEIHALINPSSTHSYVCTEHLFDKMSSVEQLEYDMHVTNPLGHSVNVNQVYKNCLIMIHDRKFSTDLIALPFHEFDLILGMDWLCHTPYPRLGGRRGTRLNWVSLLAFSNIGVPKSYN